MPKQVTDVELLQEYMHGVSMRAEHHAQNVNEIIYALVGAVVCYKDADPIKVLTQDGEMKNVMWCADDNRRSNICGLSASRVRFSLVNTSKAG